MNKAYALLAFALAGAILAVSAAIYRVKADTLDVDVTPVTWQARCSGAGNTFINPALFYGDWGPGYGIIGNTGPDNGGATYVVRHGQVVQANNDSIHAVSICIDANGNPAINGTTGKLVGFDVFQREAGKLGKLGYYRISGMPSGSIDWHDAVTYGEMYLSLDHNSPTNYNGAWYFRCPVNGSLVACGGFDASGPFMNLRNNQARAKRMPVGKLQYACIDATGHFVAQPQPCN